MSFVYGSGLNPHFSAGGKTSSSLILPGTYTVKAHRTKLGTLVDAHQRRNIVSLPVADVGLSPADRAVVLRAAAIAKASKIASSLRREDGPSIARTAAQMFPGAAYPQLGPNERQQVRVAYWKSKGEPMPDPKPALSPEQKREIKNRKIERKLNVLGAIQSTYGLSDADIVALPKQRRRAAMDEMKGDY